MTAVDPTDYKGLVTDVGFQSPSGNIACGFTTTPSARVVCQIESFAFISPASNCNGGGDGGAIVFESGSKPSFACLGDLESGGPTLNYGSKITVGGLTCASQTSGVTCLGGGSHGFLLAKERYTLS